MVGKPYWRAKLHPRKVKYPGNQMHYTWVLGTLEVNGVAVMLPEFGMCFYDTKLLGFHCPRSLRHWRLQGIAPISLELHTKFKHISSYVDLAPDRRIVQQLRGQSRWAGLSSRFVHCERVHFLCPLNPKLLRRLFMAEWSPNCVSFYSFFKNGLGLLWKWKLDWLF